MRRLFGLLGLVVVTACSSAAPTGYSSGRQSPASDDDAESTEQRGGDTPSNDDGPSATPDAGGAPRPGIGAFPGSQIFLPPTTPAPGIVMLHGSEGGSEPYIKSFAAEVAKKGFVVVTLCWFGCTGKPPTIHKIPLESVVDMGKWLKGAPEVAGGRVGLFGWSRGAEMSLLVTSLLRNLDPFRAVAVHAASDTVVSAFDPATQNNPPNYGGIDEIDPQTGQAKPAPSWTWKGQALYGEPKIDFSVMGPRILVEKYPGPVYVSHGENDEVWEAARGRRVVAARNTVATLATESHFWPGEGHVLQKPANVAAQHAEIVSFFQRKLGP